MGHISIHNDDKVAGRELNAMNVGCTESKLSRTRLKKLSIETKRISESEWDGIKANEACKAPKLGSSHHARSCPLHRSFEVAWLHPEFHQD